MMKAKLRLAALKGYVAGIVTVLALSSVVVLAAPTTLSAVFGIGVSLDGQVLDFEADSQPFVVDGRTFLPVRAIADALGLDVAHDRDNNMAVLTTPGTATAATDACEEECPEVGLTPAAPVGVAGSANFIPVTDLDALLNLQNGFVYIGRPTCPACVAFEPHLIAVVERTNTNMYYFNTDDWRQNPRFSEVTSHFDVSGVPTMILVEDGVLHTIDRHCDETPWQSYFER